MEKENDVNVFISVKAILEENEELKKENEKLKRRIFGMETTIANMRRKEEKMAGTYAWPEHFGN